MRVACCQVALDIEASELGWDGALTAVRAAAAANAEVVVLPELATSGYVFASRDEARGLAETLDGPRLAQAVALSGELGIVLVSGWCEQDGDLVRNSAVVCDRGRLAGVYRKAHLWGDEPDVFCAGTARPLVVDTSAGRIGVGICYDIEFPEWVRPAAEDGAQLIAAPVNWPLYEPPPAGERPAEVLKAQGFAAAYRVPIAIADRCGLERGVDWVGGTCIVGPDGDLLSPPPSPPPGTPRTVLADVDPTAALDKTIGHRNHLLHDRRPDLY